MQRVLFDASPPIALLEPDDKVVTEMAVSDILTVDRADFERYRLPGGAHFTLL